VSAPRRVRLSRARGWRKPPNTVVVARPSRWGNPYHVVVHGRAGALRLFEAYARERLAREPRWLAPLRGKDLACWCPLNEACHADVLLRLAGEAQ
jgi:Domain of unknown function (DUF4326)